MERALGTALVLLLVLSGCSNAGERLRRPNILLITLDTTRADRLGCYGYERGTSPNIDALCEESVRFTRAVSTSSWTLPAHASLFTAKFPRSHGARYDPEGPLLLTSAIEGPKSWDRIRARGLSPQENTLARMLSAVGYRTAAIVGGPWMKRVFGLDVGFESYDDDRIDSVFGRRAEDVTNRAIEWMRRHRAEPQFLFLNYYDPHGPYEPPEPFLSRFVPPHLRVPDPRDPGLLRASYDGEIAYMDHHIGRLFAEIRALDLWDETWIVVTADHGELLGEGGRFSHGLHLSEPELHIPLIVKFPGGHDGGSLNDSPVQLTDILPMIANHLELPVPAGAQGGMPPEVGHAIAAEVYPLPSFSKEGDWRAIYRPPHKLLWNSLGNHELYDIEADPSEESNLLEDRPLVAREMLLALEHFFDRLPPAPELSAEESAVDAETAEALKSLGYVD